MKFLMILLAVHFIAEMIGNKKEKIENTNPDERNEKVIHPAEFELRQS